MIETSAEIKDLFKALFNFQASTVNVHKDGKNPAFKSRYATLENVIDTVRPGLQAVGIVFTQAPGAIADGKLSMTTMLVHGESGQWMRSTMQIPLGKNDPQGAGSALTYSQRYSLMAALGVPPTDDDDGEKAMDRSSPGPDPHRRFPAVPHTNGKPIGLSSSQRMASDLMARLWKVSGADAVKTLVNSDDFLVTAKLLDEEDAAKVKSLIAERRAIA